jgi:hypothetical protein
LVEIAARSNRRLQIPPPARHWPLRRRFCLRACEACYRSRWRNAFDRPGTRLRSCARWLFAKTRLARVPGVERRCLVDDVVLGCVDPVGEAGGDIARMAALAPAYGDTVPGVQINRFCASGLDAVNFAAAQVMSGQHDMTIGGGVESMSRVGIGASGGAWPVDPRSRSNPISCRRASRRSDRDQIRLFARRRRRLCGRKPEARRQGVGRGPLQESVVPVKDVNGLTILDQATSTCGPDTTCSRSRR